MAYSATRLSPMAAYGRLFLLDAATLSTPSACSCEPGECSTACYRPLQILPTLLAIFRCMPTRFTAPALGVYGVAASRRSRLP
jgi:hypothetical protein